MESKEHLNEQRDSDEDGEEEHAAKPIKMQGPPASPIHEHDGDEGHPNHYGPNSYCRILGITLLQPSVREQRCGIVEHLLRP